LAPPALITSGTAETSYGTAPFIAILTRRGVASFKSTSQHKSSTIHVAATDAFLPGWPVRVELQRMHLAAFVVDMHSARYLSLSFPSVVTSTEASISHSYSRSFPYTLTTSPAPLSGSLILI